VLITVLSVMNGFGEELRARILGVVSHITISVSAASSRIGRGRADDAQRARFCASAPFVQGQGMITRGRTASA